jgi:cellulose synthase (UDP-forming)
MDMLNNLPSPPTDSQKYSYLDPKGYIIGISGTSLAILFLVSNFFFVAKNPYLLLYLAFCLIYLSNLLFCSLGSLASRKFDMARHEETKKRYINFVPSVDVFLPNCGEPDDMLDNTFAGVASLDYPDYQVWVLDDVGRDSVKLLAEKYGFNYISRPNKGELKKAGNMRYAFAQTDGEFILVFDADFVPRHDFLKETIFYFASDRRIGIIQTPQFFAIEKRQTPIQKGATYSQEVFYRLIQSFRDRWGSSVCTGSCAVYRRKALEPFGGAYPVERSEDVNTGLSVLRTGWKIKYVPIVLSMGLSPDTIKSYFHQQYRWCSGSLHLITSKLFWEQKVNIFGKFSYCLSILYYLSSGLGVIFFYTPCLINVWAFPEDFRATNYILIAPGVAIAMLAKGLWANAPWGKYVLTTAMAGSFTHLASVTDVLKGEVAPWIPTGAAKKSGSHYRKFLFFTVAIPILEVGIFSSGLIYNRSLISTQDALPSVLWFALMLFIQFNLVLEIRKNA